MSKKAPELPVLCFENQEAFEIWLESNHETSRGILLQIAKKNARLVTVSYQEALESALCYGWIDSQKKTFDDQSWLQRFTPRGNRSIWSKVNKDKAEQLIADARMKPGGLRAIEDAKRSGQWDKAYEPQSSGSVPEDFAARLELNARAKAFYDTLNKQNKFAIHFRIQNVKKQETREKRILQFVEMLERGEKIYP
ncbi:bacteriocin-protection protein [Paenibacillus chitinolyticus]|uniref:Bacteriocin-protection protein n=1 Tax=Paenibacillus chitinolyticus TaxID=79263 RepID=A0A410WYR2_9BACL|nr:YdeI/OmpD-associated family protein [Paenibacillus chitinolyticus]MCY9590445.1 YdeI/OmpD-associated family protein [Paenibacillus chitinolyticus]MCY9596560.1 YdeI/OmpD-associated family protein [Paenibacillus chitinolyticus]QAV19568.1 bacteriocin-protection protein [Paenibacillus chitinolyticus]